MIVLRIIRLFFILTTPILLCVNPIGMVKKGVGLQNLSWFAHFSVDLFHFFRRWSRLDNQKQQNCHASMQTSRPRAVTIHAQYFLIHPVYAFDILNIISTYATYSLSTHYTYSLSTLYTFYLLYILSTYYTYSLSTLHTPFSCFKYSLSTLYIFFTYYLHNLPTLYILYILSTYSL